MMRLSLLLAAFSFQPTASGSIDGLYGTECFAVGPLSATKDIIFAEGYYEMVQTVFADKDCEKAVYDFSMSGPYRLDETQSEIDFTLSNIRLTALDERIVKAFKENSVCNLQDWQLNVPLEVAGKDCGEQNIPTLYSQAFDILRLTDDGIQFGQPSPKHDGATRDTRPEDWDETVYRAK